MLNQNKHGQQSKKLLAAETPLQIPRRIMSDASTISLSVENPVADYKRLIETMLHQNLDDEEQMKRYKAIANKTRNLVWKLLFDDPQPPSTERQTKAGDLLKEHKPDASFFVPWDYNDWIVGVRDELLKRKFFDFWHNVIVKKELGPCWARDSDYFDEMEDPEPANFYRHAGAKPAWESTAENPTSADNFAPSTAPVALTASNTSTTARIPTAADLKINLDNPLEDYKKLINTYLTENTLSDDEKIQSIYSDIAECARKTVWSLLFDEPQPPTVERQSKAGDLLKEHKTDAGFYAPWVYNEWVVKLRDEVLKRELLDFWRNQMVKRELGLCWARDSDYFDDTEDPEPANFYKHAGATAAWDSAAESKPTPVLSPPPSANLTGGSNTSATARIPTATDLKINLQNPLHDYKNLMNVYLTDNTLSDDEQIETVYSDIAECARKAIWSLLFDDPQPPTVERQSKAGDLLKEHKVDAGFYAPWAYNEWIKKLKDEILKRELLDFWRNQMVKRELGLCWARDSDYFDNMEDPEPSNFYKHAGCLAPWLNEEDQNRANEHSSGDK